jgi:hypothetical protein
VAASLDGPLSASGPIPRRNLQEIMIRDPLRGSFGFELELRGPKEALQTEEPDVTEAAIDRIMAFLAGTAASDDELADMLATTGYMGPNNGL